jgi:transposase
MPGPLKAELIDSAEIQRSRKATGFDCWIMLRGTTTSRGRNGGFYIPAKRHKAINRTLALPGAVLNEGAEVYRRNGKWYARVSISVPLAEVQEPKGWLGCDVGLRSAVSRSDGYRGPDLRPILKRTKQRKADQQRNGIDRQTQTHQRQVLSGEAKRVVSVALRSGRGVSLEDPRRLPRYKQWAGRQFARRVQLLALVVGVCVALVPPPYTSITCSVCGWVEKQQRHKETFRCWQCGYTHNADFNAARIIRRRAHRYCDSHQVSLSSSPGGVGANK